MSGSAASRVVDAAAELFAERGYQATTTRQLAERAGVNEVSVFRGFGNKQGVLAAVVGRVVAEQPGRAASELTGLSLREAVTALAQREVTNGLRDGGLMTRLAFEARTVPEVAELFAGGPQANLAAMAAFFADRQRAGQVRPDLAAETVAEAFFSLTSSFVIMRTVLGFEAGSDAQVEQSVAGLVELFLSGAEAHR
ncbi:TetR family transcriptional regulator [Propionicimonas paludicola]|uniref:TetR family transcriptional regulator n=1 Tax=Propionicimonas paludicola TaxID=185243 RepID=A0A2A9CQE0_9ACTN|nr:TetR/AcrR family transcriptional regulator [Propionicimonas paludicola]PFG15832.1 TetR family transcriptional regulator [Propionicimonas paludicola]